MIYSNLIGRMHKSINSFSSLSFGQSTKYHRKHTSHESTPNSPAFKPAERFSRVGRTIDHQPRKQALRGTFLQRRKSGLLQCCNVAPSFSTFRFSQKGL